MLVVLASISRCSKERMMENVISCSICSFNLLAKSLFDQVVLCSHTEIN